MTFLWRLYNMFISYLSYPKLLLQTMLLFVWWVGHGGCAVSCRAHHDVWPNCSALETCVLLMWIFALLLFLCLAELHFFSSEHCLLGIIADVSTIGGGALGGLVVHPCHWASCPHWVSVSHPGLFCIFFLLFSWTKDGMLHKPFFFGAPETGDENPRLYILYLWLNNHAILRKSFNTTCKGCTQCLVHSTCFKNVSSYYNSSLIV